MKIEQDKNDSNVNKRLEILRNEDPEKLKIRNLQVQLRTEMEKRLSAQEEVFDLKDQLEIYRNDIALLKEQLQEAQGQDTSPLVELIKDLRVEAITINEDLNQILQEVPQKREIEQVELPEDICETERNLILHAFSVSKEYQIENIELRVLIDRLSRTASAYHRISNVISKYPVLCADDIGTSEFRGNWILPVETEHLQRCIIKLHEILSRQY